MISVRPARRGEGAQLLSMVRVLAESHGDLEFLTARPDDLEDALFRADPIIGALVAELNHEAAGCAIWHRSFSTFRGAEVMYLEDLAVLPSFRRRGIGRALLRELAGIANERGFKSIYWVMMNWNEAARSLYDSVGAEIEDKASFCRIHGEALLRLAR